MSKIQNTLDYKASALANTCAITIAESDLLDLYKAEHTYTPEQRQVMLDLELHIKSVVLKLHKMRNK